MQPKQDIFDYKIKIFMNDYNAKKNKAMKYYRIAESIKDLDERDSLFDKAEKWIAKAEDVLKKIEEVKLSKKIVLQKKNELNNNNLLETNKQENIL